METKNNVLGVGVDLALNSDFENLSNEQIKRFLTVDEYKEFLTKQGIGKTYYLAGRWVAKEAIFKAVQGYTSINLINIEILNDNDGSPNCTNIDAIKISISHTKINSIAFAILLEKN